MNQSINTDSKNSKEPQQKYRLGTVSIKILGGGFKPVLRAPNLALSFYHGSKHTVVRSAWRFPNSSMDHHVKQINHRKILWWSKDEDSTETCCDRHLEISGKSEQHHWNTGAEENQQLNPGGPSNRQKKLRPKPTKINSFTSGPSLSLTPDPPACN